MLSSRLAPWLGVLGLGAGGGILLNTGDSEGDQYQLTAKVPSRQQQLSTLSSSKPNQPFDLLVIGGGATGSGIAVDAATRYEAQTQKKPNSSPALQQMLRMWLFACTLMRTHYATQSPAAIVRPVSGKQTA